MSLRVPCPNPCLMFPTNSGDNAGRERLPRLGRRPGQRRLAESRDLFGARQPRQRRGGRLRQQPYSPAVGRGWYGSCLVIVFATASHFWLSFCVCLFVSGVVVRAGQLWRCVQHMSRRQFLPPGYVLKMALVVPGLSLRMCDCSSIH